MADDALVLRITAKTDEFVKSLEDIKKRSSTIAAEMKEIDKQLKMESVDRVAKLSEKLNLAQRSADLAAKEARKYAERIAELNKVNTSSAEEQEKVNKKINDLTEKMALAIHRSETFATQVSDLGKELDQAQNPTEDLTGETNELAESLEDSKNSANNASGGIKNFKESVLANLTSAAIQKAISGITNLFKNLAAAAWDAAKKIASTAWEWAQSGANLIETQNKVDAVFKESAEYIKEWGDNAAHNVRTTKQVAMETAASFGNIFVNMGAAADSAAKYSTRLIEVAAAQADFNNLSTEEVLQKIQSALTGNYEGLKSLGIVMNQEKVNAKALAMTHKENADQLTDLEKTLARVELIFESSANAEEKFKENSSSLVSLTAELKSRLGDLRDEIGSKLTPVFEDLFQKIADYLSSEEGQALISKITEDVEKLCNRLTEFINSGGFEEFLDKVKEKLPEIWNSACKLAEALGVVVDFILDLTEPSEYDKLKALDEAVKKSKTEVHAFAQSVDVDMDSLRTAINDFAELNNVSVTEIYNDWATYQPQIAEYMASTGQISEQMKDKVTSATGTMADQAKTDLDATAEAFQDGLTKAGQADTSALQAKTQEVEGLGSRIKRALANFIDNSGWFQNAPGAEYAHRASGGPVLPGQVYQVNDDHGRRKELFRPAVPGYILDGNRTQEIVSKATTASQIYTGKAESLSTRIRKELDQMLSKTDLLNIPHRASGGPVLPGQVYQVNDDHGQREELFRLKLPDNILNSAPAQNIVNNNNSSTSNSYENINVYVNSYGADAASIADEIGQAISQKRRKAGTW